MNNIFNIQDIIFNINNWLNLRDLYKYASINKTWNAICNNIIKDFIPNNILKDLDINYVTATVAININFDKYKKVFRSRTLYDSDKITIYLNSYDVLYCENRGVTYSTTNSLLDDILNLLQTKDVLNSSTLIKSFHFSFVTSEAIKYKTELLLMNLNNLGLKFLPMLCLQNINTNVVPYLTIDCTDKNTRLVFHLYGSGYIYVKCYDFNKFYDAYKLFIRSVHQTLYI